MEVLPEEHDSESLYEKRKVVDWNVIQFNFLKELSKGLQFLREHDMFCDITVTVDDESFRTHKVILVAISDVFRAMFTSGLSESTSDHITLQDDVDLSAEGFSLLLDFAYTGKMQLNPESVFEVLATACHLNVQPAIKTCIAYIDDCFYNRLLDYDDFWKISSMAANYDLHRLKVIADEHIARNFAEVSTTEDFVEHMTARSLQEFLQRDDLAVSSEEQILKAVSTWLKHDKDNRIHHTMPLIRKVRLGLITAQALLTHIDSDLQGIPQCKALFDQFMQHHAVRGGGVVGPGALLTKYPELFRLRASRRAIIAIGGLTTLVNTRFYDRKQEWLPLRKFPQVPFSKVSHHRAIVICGQLFVAGGEYTENNKNLTSNFFFQYNPAANRWLRLPAMKIGRSRFGMVYMDGYIYAIGGQNQSKTWIRAVERFGMIESKWQIIASLDSPLKHPEAVAYNGKLVTLGVDHNSNLDVMLFHPNQNQWTVHCSIYYPQCSLVLPIIHRNTCYQVAFSSVESKLDPTKEWKYSPDVMTYTCNFDINTKPSDSCIEISGNDLESRVEQKFIPESLVPAFRIDDSVFVVANGHVENTGIKVKSDQVYDVDLDVWNRLHHGIEGAAVTSYVIENFLYLYSLDT